MGVMCVHIIPLSRNVHLNWKTSCPSVSLGSCIVVAVVLCLPRVEKRSYSFRFVVSRGVCERAIFTRNAHGYSGTGRRWQQHATLRCCDS
jgi:hypothetical protein